MDGLNCSLRNFLRISFFFFFFIETSATVEKLIIRTVHSFMKSKRKVLIEDLLMFNENSLKYRSSNRW